MKKYLYLLFLSITAVASAQPAKQNKPATIVLYTHDGNLFEGYPLDTLVAHLNQLNTNPSLIYKVKGPETDTAASLLIQLTAAEKKTAAGNVSIKEAVVTRPVMRAYVDAGGQTRYQLESENSYVETRIEEKKDEVDLFLTLEAYRPDPLKKMRYRHWTVRGGADAKTELIIKLIKDIELYCNESVKKKKIPYSRS